MWPHLLRIQDSTLGTTQGMEPDAFSPVLGVETWALPDGSFPGRPDISTPMREMPMQ